MNDPHARGRYTRRDLEELKTYGRTAIFAALGSFEDCGLSDEDFIVRAAGLLDPDRVPGLSEVRDDPFAILEAVYDACGERGTVGEKPLAAAPHHRQQAEDVLAHRFQFYGEVHQLPEEIDWDHNPGTGHWGHDLNRFSYLDTLLRVYVDRGDPRFSRKAVALILDWIAKCDFGRAFVGTPYVFGSYLNQAIHCEAWAHCLRGLLPRGHVQPVELLRVLKSLHDQLAYLKIVTDGHAGNWPTIGCRGMLATLAALPVFRDTEYFARYCVACLAVQIDEQVLPDGVQDELTPHYHWVVINNLLSAVRSVRALNMRLEARTLNALRKMVHYAQQTIVPDRNAQVAFNDSDPISVPDPTGAVGQVGLEDLLLPPDRLGPERFRYAGVAFLRQRQDQGDLYLAFDGGPFGRGHQHEDKLGMWLFAYGRSFLVDPGRHLYDTSAASYRAFLCSTCAHSTLLIDGQGQHSRGRPDTWIAAEPVPLHWRAGEGEIRAAAAYDLGYGKENAIDVVHHREIVFLQERLWIVFDRVDGEGEHRVESRFQFAPCELHLEESRVHTGWEDANLLLWSLPSAPYTDVHVEEGQETPRGGWYSARYGLLEPAPCLSLTAQADPPFFAATLLYPYRGSTRPDISFSLEGHAVVVETEEPGEVRVVSSL